jgi:phosphoserine aminotransferase
MMQIIFCTNKQHHFGTQIKEFPSLDMPIVCDMSSDIFLEYWIFKVRYHMLELKKHGPLELH